MGPNRVFIPQATLDGWLTEEKVSIEGETLTLLPEGNRFRLKTAVRFMSEVAGGGDKPGLVGYVKDLDQLVTMGGEYASGSVVLGEDAYEVVDGFVGEPVYAAAAPAESLGAATRAALGDGPPTGDVDLLAKFFLSSK